MANWKLGKTQFNFLETTTAAGTLTLTVSSKQYQILLGTQNHTVKLPDATTMINGTGLSFIVENNSTGIITVQDNGSNTLSTLAAGTTAEFLLTDNSTSNGVWRTYASGSSTGSGIGAFGPSATPLITSQIALFAGSGSESQIIDSYGFVNNSLATSFGNLAVGKGALNGNGNSSTTRALMAGGFVSSVAVATIDYVLFAVRSNSISFGNLLAINGNLATMSSSTRGVQACGFNAGSGKLDTIQYVTMATTGNSISFGTCASGAHRDSMGFASTTRGVWGGDTAGTNTGTQIDYITIATLGNSTSFGTMGTARGAAAAGSNSIRGIWAGGENAGGRVNVIDYVTIASTGNGTSFGTLTATRRYCSGAASSLIHTTNGGQEASDVSTIEYVNIATTSNSVAFGSLTVARNQLSGNSSCHGGL